MRLLVVTIPLLVTSTGCVVYSPPTRGLPLETAAPIGRGRTGEQIEVGHVRNLATAASLRVRRGIGEDIDVSAEVTAIHVPPATSGDRPLHTRALRVGYKQRVLPWLATVAGAGAGWFPGGPFLAPDAGLVASWNNGVFEPFVTLRASTSIPLSPETVIADGSPRRPKPTCWAPAGIGARVPVEGQARERDQLRGALLFGAGIGFVSPSCVLESWNSYVIVSGGGEISF